jgi:hypothetical protein
VTRPRHPRSATMFLPLLGFVLGTLLLISSCDNDKSPVRSDPPRYLPQSSVENVMENLKRSYSLRDLEEYRTLFSDDLVFVFNEDDVSRPTNPTPSTWGFDSEIYSARSLFATESAEEVGLDFRLGAVTLSDSVNPGTHSVVMQAIHLTVHTRTDDGDPLLLIVEDDEAIFYLREYAGERASDGKNVWRIVRWEDAGSGGSDRPGEKVAVASWGLIKRDMICRLCRRFPNDGACTNVHC